MGSVARVQEEKEKLLEDSETSLDNKDTTKKQSVLDLIPAVGR